MAGEGTAWEAESRKYTVIQQIAVCRIPYVVGADDLLDVIDFRGVRVVGSPQIDVGKHIPSLQVAMRNEIGILKTSDSLSGIVDSRSTLGHWLRHLPDQPMQDAWRAHQSPGYGRPRRRHTRGHHRRPSAQLLLVCSRAASPRYSSGKSH